MIAAAPLHVSATASADAASRQVDRPVGYAAFVLHALLIATLAALLVQILLKPESVNLATACIAFASSAAMLTYLLWTPALQTHPVSTFALLGFCFTTQTGALLGQSAFGVALADNLRQPMTTFAWLAAFQAVAMAMHAFYRTVVSPAKPAGGNTVRGLLERVGLYTPPGSGTLWFMGYLGLLAFLIGSGRDGVFAKTLQGMAFLTWAPFLIPMYLLQLGQAYSRWSRQAPQLLFFSLLVVLLGLASNSRAVMLSGFMTVSLFALLLLLRSREPVRWMRVGAAALAAMVLGLAAIPVSDLATAMVVARKVRGTVSAPEMVRETWRAFQQPEVLQADREARAAQTRTRYDEHYLDNVLLARLVETKFHDNALFFASTLSRSDQEQLQETTLKLFVAVLPDPVIRRLGIDLDKADYRFSVGDYLSHLSQGGPLGGYRTGSSLAHGLALMGVGYLAVYAVICVMAFLALDLLASRRRDGVVLVSAVGMLLIWDIFLGGITGESVHSWITQYLRQIPQTVVIFLLVAGFCKGVTWLLGGLTPSTRSGLSRRTTA